MRITALVLALTVASPSAMKAVCELVCLQAAQQAAPAPASNCHGHDREPASGGPAVAGGATLCHEDAGVPAMAAVPPTSKVAPAPALVHAAVRVAPVDCGLMVAVSGSPHGPPLPSSSTRTQLRI